MLYFPISVVSLFMAVFYFQMPLSLSFVFRFAFRIFFICSPFLVYSGLPFTFISLLKLFSSLLFSHFRFLARSLPSTLSDKDKSFHKGVFMITQPEFTSFLLLLPLLLLLLLLLPSLPSAPWL